MIHEPLIPLPLRLLFDAVCDGLATAEQLGELEAVLASDEHARGLYLDYCSLHVDLHFTIGGQQSQDAIEKSVRADSTDVPAIVGAAPVNLFSTSFRSTVGYFTSGWPVAYLAATVILGIGLVIGAITHVSQPTLMVHQSSLTGKGLTSPESDAPVVGRITGMVECRWEGSGVGVQGSEDGGQRLAISGQQLQSTSHYPLATNHSVCLGDRIALNSGLMEITYNSGAKVILQGPVTYEVESAAGGYLSVGKLTVRLEKRSAVSGQRSEATNPQSLIPNPSLPPDLCPLLFSVRTPTAVVTDLGTEFGVEVSPELGTRVCVLQGRVTLQPAAAGSTETIVLKKGQSSRVDARGKVLQYSEAETAANIKSLVRRLPDRNRAAVVSLTDLVAGGDGFGDRSFWGISPQDASVIPVPTANIRFFSSSGKYERYSGRPQIDGVFIPDGSAGPVQVDSAGHTFDLPKTCGRTCDWAIWAYKGQAWEAPTRTRPLRTHDAAASSMLSLHANAGITFDLSAIRASARGRYPARFQSVVHNCQWNPDGSVDYVADVWVLVDGQSRFSRMKFRKSDGPLEIDVPMKPSDRFLTLISTDGGDAIACDNPCFLNPRLLLEAGVREEEARSDRPK
jgi:hypothetical protein